MTEGSKWFRRFVRECRRISPYIRIKRIKYGFYRIYYKHAYIGECYKSMPQIGYDHNDYDRRFDDKKFYESKEDNAELSMKVKNFVEGYFDSRDRIRTRIWMFRHDKEFNETALKGYGQVVVK